MKNYMDRADAGAILSQFIKKYATVEKEVLLLALPRGGVPVAYEIAKTLKISMDILVVRKLGVPSQEELAMGAIASGNGLYLNQKLIDTAHISAHQIEETIGRERAELHRREQLYRGNRPFPSLKNKIIILVDDGMATGACMRAAIDSLKQSQPYSIVIAVPVAAPEICAEISSMVHTVVCPLKPDNFNAVGLWYQDFTQLTDTEVIKLLQGDIS